MYTRREREGAGGEAKAREVRSSRTRTPHARSRTRKRNWILELGTGDWTTDRVVVDSWFLVPWTLDGVWTFGVLELASLDLDWRNGGPPATCEL